MISQAFFIFPLSTNIVDQILLRFGYVVAELSERGGKKYGFV